MNWILIKSLLWAGVVAKQICAYFKLLIIPLILLVIINLAEGGCSEAPSGTSSLGIKEILGQHGCCLTVKTQHCAPD